MKAMKFILLSMTVILTLSGCAGTGRNQQAGATVGAAGGAIAGALIARSSGVNPLVGALIGGVAGGLVGGAIGASLDEAERQALAAAQQRAAMAGTGERQNFSVTNTKGERTTGWVVPQAPVQTARGECRTLERYVVKNGRTISDTVQTCRTATGWDVPAV